MSKNSKVFSMSLLPVLLIVLLIIGAGFLLLEGEVKIPWLKKSNTLEIRRLEGYPTLVYTEEVKEKMRIVIKNQQELETFLKTVDSSGNLALGEKIDFNKEMLIAVASPTMDTKGYDIKIKKIYTDEKDNSLLVSIVQNKPTETCTYEKDPNIPVDMVAINKTDKLIDFELIKKDVDCEQ